MASATSYRRRFGETLGLYGRLVRSVYCTTSMYETLTCNLWQSEEVPAALLLAQAAYLRESLDGTHSRRAGLSYVTAADRLEKCGIVCLALSQGTLLLTFFLRNHSRCIYFEEPAPFFDMKVTISFRQVLKMQNSSTMGGNSFLPIFCPTLTTR